MPHQLDPKDMTPEQRSDEVAAIFARGLLRLRGITPPPLPTGHVGPSQKVAKSRSLSLEVGRVSSPHARGSEGGRTRRKGAEA